MIITRQVPKDRILMIQEISKLSENTHQELLNSIWNKGRLNSAPQWNIENNGF